MKNMKWLAGLAIALGVGATGASAQDWQARDHQVSYSNQSRVDRLRVEVARDRVRLNESIRRGNRAAIQRNREELARDQRELNALLRISRNTGWRR